MMRSSCWKTSTGGWKSYGESALVAAYRGTREVGFAVIATTMVLIAVFIPITFMQGDTGRLFTEFALTIAAAVAFSPSSR